MNERIEATLSRKSWSSFDENESSTNANGWFVVSHRWVPEKKRRRRLYGTWHKIQSDHATIYRIIRFSPSLKGTEKSQEGEIVLDWGGWLALSDYPEEHATKMQLVITKAKLCELVYAGVKHPDPAFRLASWLALLSIFLGIISVILTIFNN